MKNYLLLSLIIITLIIMNTSCGNGKKQISESASTEINQPLIDSITDKLVSEYGNKKTERITRGVNQIAKL